MMPLHANIADAADAVAAVAAEQLEAIVESPAVGVATVLFRATRHVPKAQKGMSI